MPDNVYYLPSASPGGWAHGQGRQPMLRYVPPVIAVAPVWSHTATWLDVALEQRVTPQSDLPHDWARQWTLDYRHGRRTLSECVADVPVVDLASADPKIRNTWHRGRTARAGKHEMASTGLDNAHASGFERQTLICVDFHGADAVASQPFTLTYELDGNQRTHTPDFFVVLDGIPTIVNCRPSALVGEQLLEDVAALGAVASTRGWDNRLIVDYDPTAYANLHALTGHTRNVDPFSYGPDIEDRLRHDGPTRFDHLTDPFEAFALARSVVQKMLWDRELAIDLHSLLEEDTTVYLPEQLPAPNQGTPGIGSR